MIAPGHPTIDCPDPLVLGADTELWRLYNDAFPRDERDPVHVVLKTVETAKGLAFRLCLHGHTIGLALTHLLTEPPAVFLVYLAVAARFRNIGYGQTLFHHATAMSVSQLTALSGQLPVGVIWEVDPPKAAHNSDEELRRRRRVEFFERIGAHVILRPYQQPPLNGGQPVPMSLMFQPVGLQQQPDDETVRALIYAMYFEKYGAMNGIDPDTLEPLLRAIGVFTS